MIVYMEKKTTFICDCPEGFILVRNDGCKKCNKKETRGGDRRSDKYKKQTYKKCQKTTH